MKSNRDYVQGLYLKAQSDLKIARRELLAPDPATDAVCFHFQQAVEKLLKAWLAWNGVTFPLTHNIEVLLAACEKVEPDFARLRPAEALTPYAVDIRYADDIYFPSLEEAQKAEALASSVEAYVLDKLTQKGLKPDRQSE